MSKHGVPWKRSFKKRGILQSPIRIRGRDVYYFDSQGIYQKGHLEKPCLNGTRHIVWHSKVSQLLNTFSWQKAVSSFLPGMTLAECLERFKKTKREPIPTDADYTDFERLVQKIERPQFERTPENTSKKAIDRIRIDVHLPRYLFETRGALKDAIVCNRAAIDQLVIRSIETSPGFRKLGIPIGFFSLTECTIRRDYILEYLFELKNL